MLTKHLDKVFLSSKFLISFEVSDNVILSIISLIWRATGSPVFLLFRRKEQTFSQNQRKIIKKRLLVVHTQICCMKSLLKNILG